MKVFEVKPLNSVWLGGLKNISAGDEHYITSNFPPNIMRFFRFVKKDGKGACYGVLFVKNGKILLNSPADIVGKRKIGGSWRILEYSQELKCPLIRGTIEAYETASGYLITTEGFEKWEKRKNLEDNDLIKQGELYKIERRTGIKIDKNKGTAEERMLYTQERIRLNDDVKILFLADNCYKYEGFFGGERTPAYVRQADEYHNEIKEIIDGNIDIVEGEYYRLYLLTHTYVNIEKALAVRDLKNEENILEFELVWLYSAGNEFISGYGKPAVNMLKPGTVLLLRAKSSGTLSRTCQILDEPKVSEIKDFLGSGWNTGILVSEGGAEK